MSGGAALEAMGHAYVERGVRAAGLALLAAFAPYERRVADPMLPTRLFASRGFTSANLASMLMSFGMFGSIFLLAQFLQMVQGYSPLAAGPERYLGPRCPCWSPLLLALSGPAPAS